jgi:hypothetical protein
VIGNSKYDESGGFGPLATATNDAEDVGKALCGLGFHVIFGFDLDDASMRQILEQFRKGNIAHNPSELRLFYFSGHGMQLSDHNYLIPTNVEFTNQEKLRRQAIDVNLVYGALTQNGNGTLREGNQNNIIILDACRNNALTENTFKSGFLPGLALPVEAPLGTLVAFSTAPGTRAADVDPTMPLPQRHSPYTAALMNHLREPGLAIPDLFNKVRLDVAGRSRGVQVPWENVSTLTSQSLAPAVVLEWRVDAVDDVVSVFVNGYPVLEETAPTDWVKTPKQLIHSGTNAFEVVVYNDKTRRGGSPFGSQEGWKYELSLRVDGQEVSCHGEYNHLCQGREDVPTVGHWGQVFSVLKGDIIVNADTGNVSLGAGSASLHSSVVNAHPFQLSRPEYQIDLDWSIRDGGSVEGEVLAEWGLLGITSCDGDGGRACAMKIAISAAKGNEDERAYRIALSTQLHNPHAADIIRNVGALAVASYLRTK